MDKYLIALGRNIKIGPQKFSKLFSYFESAEKIWKGSLREFINAGLEEKSAADLVNHISKTDPDKEVELLNKYGIKALSIFNKDYPAELKNIFSPPFILYVKGSLRKNEPRVAIVGSRKTSDYGARVTKDITEDLSEAGVVIVSGLALGVDAIAHAAAVRKGKRTIAVLGCGLDQVYPSSNVNLAKEILKNGAIVSEYPLGTRPLKHNFPARNRIISGLSKGVLVTEATEKSGSLITATQALEQGKDIFAVPGSIFNLGAKGPNNLIKMGAKLVTEAKDVLEELNLEHIELKERAKEFFPASKEEAEIVKIIKAEAKHIDEIIKLTKIEAHKASSTLALMEIKGVVKNLGGMMYTLNI